jgi:DNA-binding transcriptional MerR regulator
MSVSLAAVVAAVVMACLVGYFIGRGTSSREGSQRPKPGAETANDYDASAHVASALVQFDSILCQDRDLTQKELEAYTNLIVMRNAARIAAENGRKYFTPSDLQEGIGIRQAKVAEADAAFAEIQHAADLWEKEERETGTRDGPAGDHAREVVRRYEQLLSEAGEINELRAFRQSLASHAPPG